jgi:hypothetical protein
MHLQNKIFIDRSREPLSGVGGRPVHVINAVLRIRAQKFRSQPLCEPVAATVSWMVPRSPRNLRSEGLGRKIAKAAALQPS